MQLDVSEHLSLFSRFSVKKPIDLIVNAGIYHLCFRDCIHIFLSFCLYLAIQVFVILSQLSHTSQLSTKCFLSSDQDTPVHGHLASAGVSTPRVARSIACSPQNSSSSDLLACVVPAGWYCTRM